MRYDGVEENKEMESFNDYSYKVTDNQEIVIVRYQGNEKSPLIPAEIDGLPVTIIGIHAFAGSDIADIALPEGIRKIEKEAFALCDHLESVRLPASLQELGSAVFMGSELLKTIDLAEDNARYLLSEGVLFDRQELALVLCPPGLDQTEYAVPFGIQAIAYGAFYMNRKLRYVALPDTLKKIGSSAFLFTDSLPFITLPPNLEEMAADSFLMINGPMAEKVFYLNAYVGTPSYELALKSGIHVNPLIARLVG